jgi:hypothetical protein
LGAAHSLVANLDLKTFVSESLSQIIQGVEEAQCQNKQSLIVPWSSLPPNESTEKVEFDVAVTVEKGTETKGGIAVIAGVIGLGSQGRSSQSDQTVSRINTIFST